MSSLLVVLLPVVVGADSPTVTPSVAIIIDDLGNKLSWGRKAIKLPGPVALSFLPHTPHVQSLANQAHAAGKEVMLHMPMEAESGKQLGPGGLTLHMTEQQLHQTTRKALGSVPYATGLNNHMGSLLTRHPGAMSWLMDAIKDHGGLFFVDSRTTDHSVADQVAVEKLLPAVRRDVFLDNVRTKTAIKNEFRRLLQLAKKRGYAVAIGHPYPETMQVLKQELAGLSSKGIRLIPISEIVALQKRGKPWQAPLSHSPKVVKSSKQ
ncbi:MAG: divergent polysaccharide deacetylase family protein [Gammaproteobacteria bacterium]|nr:divergent polysaccharide deacetylase family protein [Gammaproteobacteria bacterium]